MAARRARKNKGVLRNFVVCLLGGILDLWITLNSNLSFEPFILRRGRLNRHNMDIVAGFAS
jgi:hypothetical protein